VGSVTSNTVYTCMLEDMKSGACRVKVGRVVDYCPQDQTTYKFNFFMSL
jgi:hypothetical protein